MKKTTSRYFSNFSNYSCKKYLDFNIKNMEIDFYNVNLSVIENFNLSNQFENLDKFPEEIKKFIEEEKKEFEKNSCIDALAVYIAPQNEDKANILMSKEKITKTAEIFNIDTETLYNFIKIHEYAHACICSQLGKRKNCNHKNENYELYTFIEESLATAIALKKLKKDVDFHKLEKFVEHQPPQYSYALKLIEKYENHKSEVKIENLMRRWRFAKCFPDIYKIFLEYLINANNTHIQSELFKKTNDAGYLLKSTRDFFFQYFPPY